MPPVPRNWAPTKTGTCWFKHNFHIENPCRLRRERIYHNQEPHALLDLARDGEQPRAGWPVKYPAEVGGERPG